MLCAKCRCVSTLNRMLVISMWDSCCPTNWSNLIDPLAQAMFLDVIGVIGEFFGQHCLDFLGRLFVSELFPISWWYIACVCFPWIVWRCWFEFAVSSLKQPSLQASECTCDAVTVTMEQVAIWVFCRVCNISQWFLDTLTKPFFVCLHKPTKSWGVGFSHSVRSNVSRQRLKVLFVVFCCGVAAVQSRA